ncbi:MAG: 2-oxoglutarate carboxylase large subunit [bacterium]|nr:2-oxoglutarate carboxylase large subunit [bacterium]
MKITVTIEGSDYVVDITPQPHEVVPGQITVNGRTVSIDVQGDQWLSSFPRSLLVDGVPYEAQFDAGDDGFPAQAWINGRPQPVHIDFAGKGNLTKKKGVGLSQEAAGNAVAAPMPGKIVAIKVKEGQSLEPGQLCIVLEAMKMENELAAPRACKVKKVLCEEGANVDLDQVLVTFED